MPDDVPQHSQPLVADTSCQVNLNPGGHSDGINLGGGSNSDCGVTAGNPLPSSLSAAQRSAWINHLTIQGVSTSATSLRIRAASIELDNDAGSHFFIGQGAYHVYIQGGDYANETDASQPTIGDTTCGCGNWPPAEDVHVSGAVVHDLVTAPVQVTATASSSPRAMESRSSRTCSLGTTASRST